MKFHKKHYFVLLVFVSAIRIIIWILEDRGLPYGNMKGVYLSRMGVAHLSLAGRPVFTRRFTKIQSGSVYVFGAVTTNSTRKSSWDLIKVFAMLSSKIVNSTTVYCCLLYSINSTTRIHKMSPLYLRKHWAEADFIAHRFSCANPRQTSDEVPSHAGLTVDGVPCHNDVSRYVKPVLTLKQPGTSLALTTQVAYGNISAELIIEWMETYKYLGVDKVVTYYYKDLNEDALKVLQYYHNSGFMDLYHYILAAEDIRPRQLEDASQQTYNDLTVANYDTFERMSGYTYFGVIDFDEFLIPAKNRTLKQMMNVLYRSVKQAAGFQFQTLCYYLSWGPSPVVNDMIIGRYLNRTSFGPQIEKPKLIYKPKLINYKTTHTIKPRKYYKRYVAPVNIGYIRHYRNCRTKNSTVYEECLYAYGRVRDDSVAEWSSKIHDNVRSVRKQVFGSESYQ